MLRATIIFMVFCTQIVLAQTTETHGNLLRIHFTQTEIDFSDTLGSWHEVNTETSFQFSHSYYFGVIQTDESVWFQNSSGYSFNPPTAYWGGGGYSLQNINDDTSYGYWSHDGYVHHYYNNLIPQVYNLNIGYWFLSPDLQAAYLNNYNEFYSITPWNNNELKILPLFICGKVDNLFLLVMYGLDEQVVEYSLVDLSNSPEIKIDTTKYVTFEQDIEPGKIEHFIDSTYVVEDLKSRELYFCDFSKNRFINFFPFINYIPSFWKLYNSSLYAYSNGKIFGQGLFADWTEDVATDVSAIDRKMGFATISRNDSFFVFDFKNQRLINGWDLSSIDHRKSPIIDSPYVYIHQATRYVGVNESEIEVPEKFELSAYPNPFNPVTNINYSVPELSRVKIIIYNLLGEEIEILLDEEKSAGSYKIKLDAGNFPSGVYYCIMKTEKTNRSIKLLLIK